MDKWEDRKLDTHITLYVSTKIQILFSWKSILIRAVYKTSLYIKTRGPRWSCVTHLITRQVSNQLVFRFKRGSNINFPNKRAMMALYRSPDYQTSLSQLAFRFKRRNSILIFKIFFFDLGFTALSRICHLYRADRSSKVGENRRTRRKTTWPSVSRTWLSHIWPERGSNHSGEKPNGLRVNSLIH